MRAGLPVVATRVGGAPIQVGPEGERFLVAPGDRQALADRLLELIEDETLRLRLGTACAPESRACSPLIVSRRFMSKLTT